MRTKKYGFIAVITAATLLLAACGGGGSASTSANKSNVKEADYLHAKYDDLKQGGTLTLPIVEVGEQQNPFHQDSAGYTSVLWYWYNPQIALFTDDAKWEFNKNYLSDVKAETKNDKTIVTFTIQPQAKWNDGSDIDWTAFKATWEINNGANPDNFPANSTDGYQDIESVVQGANPKQAVVTFKHVYSWWQGLFNMIANPHLADPNVYKEGYLKKVHPEWGAGPYKVDNFDFEKGTASFVPNEKWWGPKAKLDKVIYRQMEAQASINAFKNGEIDATAVASKDRYAAVKDMKDISIYTSMLPYNSLVMLNSASPNLKDIKVRQAVMEAMDRAQLAKIRFQGLPYTEPLPGSFLLFPTQKGYQDNFAKAVKFSPDNAKKLLDEAGWKPGADGIREKDGKKLTLVYPLLGDSPTIKALTLATQQMLKAVGIDMQIKERPSKEFSQVYTKKEFDIFGMSFSSTDPFGVAYFGQIYGSDSGLNLSGTGTEAFDKKIKELQSISDPQTQIKKANELEVEAFKLYGIMPQYNGPDIYVTKKGLANQGSMGFAKIAKENIGWAK